MFSLEMDNETEMGNETEVDNETEMDDETEVDNETEPDETGSLTGSTISQYLRNESRHKYEKASEDLMAVFNQAEAIYHEQKVSTERFVNL